MSFIQESQRYCGYDKDKFDGEITFIRPSWLNKLASGGQEHNPETGYSDMFEQDSFIECLKDAESAYMAARIAGLQPQEARSILPNATKTEIVVTGFASDWRYFFDLRLFGKTGKPHSDMLLLAQKAKTAAEEAGIWNDIMKHPSKFD